jgi:signal transduction histidine kinase
MRSLRSRFILSHILPILIILPLMGFSLISLLRSQVVLANLSSELTHQAMLVASAARNYSEIWYDPGRAEAFVADVGPSLMAQVTLIDASGHVLVSNDPALEGQAGQQTYILPELKSEEQQPKLQIDYVSSHSNLISDVLAPVVNQAGVIGYVRLSNPLIGIDTSFQNLRQLIFIVMGAGLVAGIVMGLILAIQLERPLKQTTEAVYQLANGETLAPVKESGPEEMRLLLRAFNTLINRLQSMEASRRQLLANLVHELGRPLGALQSGIQALQGGADEDPLLRKDLLNGMSDELLRLRRLLDDLAHLHDQVLGTLELDLRPTDMKAWLTRTIAPWREAAQDHKQTFEVSIEEYLPGMEIDPERLGQALGNLLSNAVSYTPLNGRVSVEARLSETEFQLSVSDTGPGLAAGEEERIFEPFVRGKAARRFSDGMGLGLSIARDIIRAHGGRIWAENQPGSGSRFTFALPLKSMPELSQPEAAA